MNTKIIERLDLEAIESTDAQPGDPLIKRDLALVGHVPVRLTAVVGETELSIQQLFALRSGSVLTLDQTLDAPVLLHVNGKAVAQAELLAIDDCFGVRITRVLE